MDGKITFGINKKNWNGPTPAYIAWRIDIWTAVLGVLTISANSAPFMTAEMASSASWFLGAGVAVLQAIKPFYSVEVSAKKVDVDKVEVMETDEKEKP